MQPTACSTALRKVEEKLDALLKETRASVLVSDGQSLLLSRIFGEATSPATPFALASVTKVFTALAVMSLVEEGKLDLNSPLTEYLPREIRSDAIKAWGEIRITHLLNHTSGISDYVNEGLPGSGSEPVSPRRIVASLPGRLKFRPGTQSRYSNTNYLLLSLIVERITGRPFAQYVRATVLDRIGLRSTGFFGIDRTTARPGSAIAPSNLQGNGNMFSSSADLLRLLQALDGDRLLSRRWIDRMFNSVHEPAKHSLGFKVKQDSNGSVESVYHVGQLNHAASLVAKDLRTGANLVILSQGESQARKLISDGGILEPLTEAGCFRGK